MYSPVFTKATSGSATAGITFKHNGNSITPSSLNPTVYFSTTLDKATTLNDTNCDAGSDWISVTDWHKIPAVDRKEVTGVRVQLGDSVSLPGTLELTLPKKTKRADSMNDVVVHNITNYAAVNYKNDTAVSVQRASDNYTAVKNIIGGDANLTSGTSAVNIGDVKKDTTTFNTLYTPIDTRYTLNFDKCMNNVSIDNHPSGIGWKFMKMPETDGCGASNSYWYLDIPADKVIPSFKTTYTFEPKPFLTNKDILSVSAKIMANQKTEDYFTFNYKQSAKNYAINTTLSLGTSKTVDKHKTAVDEEFTYEISAFNGAEISLKNFQVIDIFPYNGDGRGTNFNGKLSLESVSANSNHTDDGTVIEYTTNSQATLSADPDDPKNSAPGVWNNVAPNDLSTVTGIRFSTDLLHNDERIVYNLKFKRTPINGDPLNDSIIYNSLGKGTIDNGPDIPKTPDILVESVIYPKINSSDIGFSLIDKCSIARDSLTLNNLPTGLVWSTSQSLEDRLTKNSFTAAEVAEVLKTKALYVISLNGNTIELNGNDINSGYYLVKDQIELNNQDCSVFGDRVWLDTDNDGIQDSGENSIKDVPVLIFAADVNGLPTGNPIFETKTDENGNWLWHPENTDSTYGNYVVKVVSPEGYGFTAQQSGTDQMNDSNVNEKGFMSLTYVNELVQKDNPQASQENLSYDAGLVTLELGTIGNVIWYDSNNNGIHDKGEKGVEGITVNLLDKNGNIIDTVLTDNTGNYLFTQIKPGDYRVAIVLPEDKKLTDYKNGSDPDLDSDFNLDGLSEIITVNYGDNIVHIDGGLVDNPIIVPEKGSIGDKVWFDSNKNGIQYKNEKGVANLAIHLLDKDGNILQTTKTDENGNYLFSDLDEGEYQIQLEITKEWKATAQTNGDIDLDSDINASGLTEVITLSAGENIRNIDMGLVKSSIKPGIITPDKKPKPGIDADKQPSKKPKPGIDADKQPSKKPKPGIDADKQPSKDKDLNKKPHKPNRDKDTNGDKVDKEHKSGHKLEKTGSEANILILIGMSLLTLGSVLYGLGGIIRRKNKLNNN